MRFTENEIIINKNFLYKILNILISSFLLLIAIIFLKNIDLKDFGRITILDFIAVTTLTLIIIFTLHKLSNIILNSISYKRFVYLSLIVSIILCILRLDVLLTHCIIINFRFALYFISAIFRNIMIFVLSTFLFKTYLSLKLNSN